MVLFTILLLMLLIIGVVLVLALSTIGAGAIVIFGDVIVCAVFIVLIIRWLIKRKKK